MKKNFLYIALFLLINSNVLAEENIIRKLIKINDVGLGDTALRLMDIKDLNDRILETKDHYNYLKDPHRYSEIYLYKNDKKNLIDIKEYDAISFFVSSGDPNFTILRVRGMIRFDNNFDGCLNFKSKEIDKYKELLIGFKRNDETSRSKLDKPRKSKSNTTDFFSDEFYISFSCSDWSKEMTDKFKYYDAYSFTIGEVDMINWMRGHNN